MIPDEIVEQVADAADSVAIIGEYVALKRHGNSYRGPCPFHGGKGPNFSVQPGKGYKCFVCGESGSVFTFLQKHLGLTFVDAVKSVGERVGIEVPDVKAKRDDEPDWRAPHWEMHAAAAEWCQRILWEDERGAAAREYLAGRGIGREQADRFGLGFAPREGASLRQHLESLGFSAPRQLESGLLAQREGSDELRARFRDRLMIPIQDVQGHHVGFGGRLLGPGEPKYLNSPESPVFSKGKLLYLLHAARPAMRKRERALVVEGYFDAIRLHLVGVEETVAPMGTALTDEQAELLARVAPTVFLLYDADAAGQRATFRSGLELLRHGATVRVVTFPEGEDPDSYVAKGIAQGKGAAVLEERLTHAVDLFERQIQVLRTHGYFADLHKKREAIDKLLPTIRACRDSVTRELYLSRLVEETGVDRAVLLRELDSAPRRAGRSTAGGAPATASDEAPRGREADGPRPPREAEFPDDRPAWRGKGRKGGRYGQPEGWRAVRGLPSMTSPALSQERALLRLMVHIRRIVEEIAEQVDPRELDTDEGRELFLALASDAEQEVEVLAGQLSDGAVGLLQDLLAEKDAASINSDRTKDDLLTRFRVRRLRRRMDDIQRELEQADEDTKLALLAEKARVNKELLSLKAT
ncbi:MAG: DNA primase [Gemmatimonadaceae bacterium]|nr:DNA primase [Gemmatimonadaceae bacterium]